LWKNIVGAVRIFFLTKAISYGIFLETMNTITSCSAEVLTLNMMGNPLYHHQVHTPDMRKKILLKWYTK